VTVRLGRRLARAPGAVSAGALLLSGRGDPGWASPRPRTADADPAKCACDECSFDKINTAIYTPFYFYDPARLYEGRREFTLMQLMPVIFRGTTAKGAKSARC
jgi:hypothetical protein